jgi:uncharacterized protein YqhQ
MLPIARLYTGPLRKTPFVRGFIVLLETLVLGVLALNRSAQMAMGAVQEQGVNPNGAPQVSAAEKGAIIGSMTLALVLGVGLFFLLPLVAARSLDSVIASSLVSNLLEGALRLVILIGYIWLVGRLRDVQRVFAYHGAEHMAIHAYEHKEPLEVERVARYPTAHPRCGTAFLLVVVVVSIVVFALLGRPALWLSILSRVALVPVIASISYELIRLSGAHAQKPLAKLLVLPGLALQGLTTRQPDASQMEVAIAAVRQALAADGVPEPGVRTGDTSTRNTLPQEGAPQESAR